MTFDPGELSTSPGPLYRTLADLLAKAIGDGRLGPGERLPPQRDLAHSLKITVGTVGRAYDILIRRGLVRGEVGRGTYVRDSRVIDHRVRLEEPTGRAVVDLTMNVPAPTAAMAALPELVGRAGARLSVAELGCYSPTNGLRRHREAAAHWLVRLGVAAEADQVLFSAGAQGGLAAALVATARPEDTVLVEALTYTGFSSTARSLSLRVEGVPLDADGVRPDALAAAARATGARVAILTPNLHNPTAIRLSASRRGEVAEVARAHDLLLIEDDVYGPLVAEASPTLVSLAPERTFYLSSLSKFLAPALRIGLLVPPAAWLDRTALAMADLTLGPSLLAAETFALLAEEGHLQRAVGEQRAAIKARQDLAARELAGLPVWTQEHALHLWLPLPDGRDPPALAVQLAAQGVMVASSSRFQAGPSDGLGGLRVSLGAVRDLDQLAWGLARVKAVLSGAAGLTDRLV